MSEMDAVRELREKSRRLFDIMSSKKADYFAAKKTYEASEKALFHVIDFGPDSQRELFPAPDAETNGADAPAPGTANGAGTEKKPRGRKAATDGDKPNTKTTITYDPSWRSIKVSDAISVGAVCNELEKLDPPVLTLGECADWLGSGKTFQDLPGITDEKFQLARDQLNDFWTRNPQFTVSH